MSIRLESVYRWMTEAERMLATMLLSNWKGRDPSILVRLMRMSPELADAVAHAQASFHLVGFFRLTPSPGLIERALGYNDAVLALISKHVKDPQLAKRAEDIFVSRHHALREGSTQLEEAVSALAAGQRRLNKLARKRLANAPSEELKVDIQRAVEAALANPQPFLLSPAHREALEAFREQISFAEESIQSLLSRALPDLIETLGRSKAANRRWIEWVEGSALKPTPKEFAAHFAQQRNYVKGILGEIWFAHASFTRDIRLFLEVRTLKRAARLSRGDLVFTADRHIGPLFDESGKQIFDGIHFVRREGQTGGGIDEIHLDSVIEVKTGSRSNYAAQQWKDQLRELGADDRGLKVRTADGHWFLIKPPPDAEDPIRIFVAPDPPEGPVLKLLETSGITTVHVPTLPSADEFGLVADFFLLAMLNRL